MKPLTKCLLAVCFMLFAGIGVASAQNVVVGGTNNATFEPPSNWDQIKLMMQQQANQDGEPQSDAQMAEQTAQGHDDPEVHLDPLTIETQQQMIAEGYYPIPGFTYTGNPDVDGDAFLEALDKLSETDYAKYQYVLSIIK